MTLLRLLAALLCLSAAGLAVAEPYRPDDDRLVLLRVTPREAPQFAELWVARAAMRASPGNLERALDFARRAIDVGRRHGDPRFMSYAEAALARWQGPETPLEVRVIRATLAQNRHAFEAALKELDLVLDAEPNHAQARLTRAVVHKVQGRPAEALRDCAALLGRASPLIVATCTADSAGLGPKPASALAFLEAEMARAPDAPIAERLWAYTVRAEMAERLGAADAESYFREALRLDSAATPDPYLLNAYADFLLEEGRPADARNLLSAHADGNDALLRLTIAERQLVSEGDRDLQPTFERHRQTLAQTFAASQRRGDRPHRREWARYLLEVEGDATKALPAAIANWSEQREPADTLLLLDAAIAAGQPEAAEPVRAWLQKVGLEDVRIQRRLDA